MPRQCVRGVAMLLKCVEGLFMSFPWVEKLKHPSLRLTIIGIVFIALLPTLGVVGLTLYKVSNSFREATEAQLLETARTIASSTGNELESTANLLLNFAELHGNSEKTSYRSGSLISSGTYAIFESAEQNGQQVLLTEPASAAIKDLALRAMPTQAFQVSNILGSGGVDDPLHVAMAISDNDGFHASRVVTLSTAPQDLIQSVTRQTNGESTVILAITDGAGRIIGRSRDGGRLIGKPVPDWDRLVAKRVPSGILQAQTLEGGQIIFAFQSIPGTPGWMAVAGESAQHFNARWQGPIKAMAVASIVTVLAGLLLALYFAQRALRPIRHLAERAEHIAQSHVAAGHDINIPPSFVAEFETLRTSLDQADLSMRKMLEDSRNAEQLAQENNKVLREAERLARIGHWSLDVSTGQMSSSDMLSVMFGVEPSSAMVSVPELQQRMTPESFQRVGEAITRCITTGEPYGLEIEHLRTDGSRFPAYLLGKAVYDESGAIVRLDGTLQDISERKEQSDRLKALADNLPSGAIFRIERGAQRELSFTYLSAGLEKITGISVQEVMQRPQKLMRVVPVEALRSLWHALRYAYQPGQVIDREFSLRTRSGESLWIHCRAALRLLGNGRAVWDGIARDVTVEHEAAKALHMAKEAAEAAERSKSDFLATMSHEIRTPMNSVIGMSRLALRTELDPKQRNYLVKINESANVLLGIINDILDFSKIEAGAVVLEGVPFRLESVLETVSSITSLRAEEKGLEITFAVAADAPAVLKGDPLRFGQVITNLVGNAIKFTEQGDIVVSISTLRQREGGASRLLVSVRDTGTGLSAGQIEGLFRPFMQAQTDTSRRYGGTGLGLAISKRLVEMMGGEIWVESEPGQGSTFFFTIRLEEVADAILPTTHRQQASHALQSKRILIVDDNASARAALGDMVAAFGMETVTVDGGLEALEVLRSRAEDGAPFDIVLLDWRMPIMDGIETARHIKADAQLEHMPAVLMVTAYSQDAVIRASDELELQGVLLKPVTQSLMFNTLLGILNDHTEVIQTTGHSHVSDAQSQALRYAGLAGKRILVTDDNALNREVASDFLEYVGVIVGSAVDGRDAIRQLERQEFDAILMDMHMPEMDGLEATREIRRHAKWADLPIIALTAQTREEDQRLALQAGMNGHLSKPIDEESLYAMLLAHCVRAKGRGTADPAPATAARSGASPLRRENLLRGFLRDFASLPAQVEHSAELGRWAEVAELAHQIKGSAGYLDAGPLCAVAEWLETAARAGDVESARHQVEPLCRLTRECLDGVQAELNQLAADSDAVAAPETLPLAEAIALVDAALPLVARGDYRAQSVLDCLAQGMQGTPWQDMAREARDVFDDLELGRAGEILVQLRFCLAGDSTLEPSSNA